MMPPRKAMSVPARSGTYRSATALVRVKRGSTWMTFAPRALASITHWKPTGWHSAMFEPSMTMQSVLLQVLLERGRATPAEARSPDRGRWRSVKSGPGSRSGSPPAP